MTQYNHKNLGLGRSQLYILFILAVIFISVPDLVYAHPANQATDRFPRGTPGSQSTQQTPAGIVIGDMDADGDLDMVSSDPTSVEIFLTDNTSQQAYTPIRIEFKAPVQVPSQPVVRRTLLGDMNGDGLLDIISADGQDIDIFFNKGGSNFPDEPNHTLTISNTLHHPYDIAIGDINSDSRYEIVAAMPNEIIRFDDIFNGLQTKRIFVQAADQPRANSVQIELGNMDQRDGLDLIYFSDTRRDIYLNNYGIFASPVSISDSPTNLTKVANLLVGDIDRKNSLDMISIEETTDRERQYVIYYSDDIANANTIPFTRTVFYTLTGSTTTLSDQLLALGDITNDGWLDIILAAPENNAKHRYWRNRSGDFVDTPTEIETRPIPVCCITTADMNQDGFLDFIARHLSVNYIYYNAPIYLFNESSINNQVNNQGSGLECDNLNERTSLPSLDPYEYQQLSTFNCDTRSQFLAILEEGIPVSQGDIETHTNVIETIIKPISRFGIRNFLALPWNNLTFVTDRLLDQISPNTWDRMATTNHTVQPTVPKILNSVAIGDLNQDGFSDFVLAKNSIETQLVHTTTLDIYLNNTVDGFNKSQLLDRYQGYNFIRDIVIQDMNNDGFPDIIIGNNNRQNKLYINQGSGTNYQEYIFGRGLEYTNKVAVADLNSDGWLDIATTNDTETFVYTNIGNGTIYHRTVLTSTVSPVDHSSQYALWVADIDGNGNLDIGSELRKMQFTNHLNIPSAFTNNPSYVTTVLPTQTQQTMLFDSQLITIEYRLHDDESDPVRAIRACYSVDGGGNWQIAMEDKPEITDPSTIVTPAKGCPYSPQLEAGGQLSQTTSPTGTTHSFVWDTFKSDFFGGSDNVVFRIEVFSGFYPTKNSTPGTYQRVSASSVSQRFHVRGIQVQVVDDTGQPVSGAKVYRIPDGQNSIGQLIRNGSGSTVFQTNDQGYLQGRGAIGIGDKLLALAPQSLPITNAMQWAAGLTDTIHLYYTSGIVTETGVTTWISNTKSITVKEWGVQVLQVSKENPLILVDLSVALEWDAQQEPRYQEQLKFDIERASQYLYDFTDGQMALGNVTVFQDRNRWTDANIAVHVSNRLRPYATIGGIVLTDTNDFSVVSALTPSIPITYSAGQVHMGSVWNRYGDANPEPGADWSLTLAHELGHYLLFLEDTYIGLSKTKEITEEEVLIKVSTCLGSAMGDVYDRLNNSEFIADPKAWQEKCKNTLANRELNRDEWTTIHGWYPLLITPTVVLSGPTTMPFAFTKVEFKKPLTPTGTLVDHDFYLRYKDGQDGSTSARAFLMRNHGNNVQKDEQTIEYDRIYDLGRAFGNQNLLRTHGVKIDDRLCVFDQRSKSYGCEVVSPGDEEITLHHDDTWNPVIHVTPVTSVTFAISVSNVITAAQPSLQLQARIYPVYETVSPSTGLTLINGWYQGIITLTEPSMAGHVHISNLLGLQEAIVAYTIGDNPGNHRGTGGGDKTIANIGGRSIALGEAPLVSSDGQMVFVATKAIQLDKGEFYLIQDMIGIPVITSSVKTIGPGYLLTGVGISNTAKLLDGTISFEYNGLDLLIEKVEEDQLQIYFQENEAWQPLITYCDRYYNLVSARSRGPGVYVLAAKSPNQSQPSCHSALPD